jgi:glycerol-3-phosphate dehydrogenase
MCINLVDFYTRRVPLMLSHQDHGLKLLTEISSIFKTELNWSDEKLAQEKLNLNEYIKNELAWKNKFIS